MSFYRKRPVVIEAIQLVVEPDGRDNSAYIARWCGGRVMTEVKPSDHTDVATWVDIPTLEGVMRASVRDWVIRGVSGEFYPCKPDIFAATYEPAETTTDGPADDAWIARAVHPQRRPQPYYDGGRLTDGGGAS